MKPLLILLALSVSALAQSSLDKRPLSATQTTSLSQTLPVRPANYPFTDMDGFASFLKDKQSVSRKVSASGGKVRGRTQAEVEAEAQRQWQWQYLPYHTRHPYAVRDKQPGSDASIAAAAAANPASASLYAEVQALKIELSALQTQISTLSGMGGEYAQGQFQSAQEIYKAKKKLYDLKLSQLKGQ